MSNGERRLAVLHLPPRATSSSTSARTAPWSRTTVRRLEHLLPTTRRPRPSEHRQYDRKPAPAGFPPGLVDAGRSPGPPAGDAAGTSRPAPSAVSTGTPPSASTQARRRVPIPDADGTRGAGEGRRTSGTGSVPGGWNGELTRCAEVRRGGAGAVRRSLAGASGAAGVRLQDSRRASQGGRRWRGSPSKPARPCRGVGGALPDHLMCPDGEGPPDVPEWAAPPAGGWNSPAGVLRSGGGAGATAWPLAGASRCRRRQVAGFSSRRRVDAGGGSPSKPPRGHVGRRWRRPAGPLMCPRRRGRAGRSEWAASRRGGELTAVCAEVRQAAQAPHGVPSPAPRGCRRRQVAGFSSRRRVDAGGGVPVEAAEEATPGRRRRRPAGPPPRARDDEGPDVRDRWRPGRSCP